MIDSPSEEDRADHCERVDDLVNGRTGGLRTAHIRIGHPVSLRVKRHRPHDGPELIRLDPRPLRKLSKDPSKMANHERPRKILGKLAGDPLKVALIEDDHNRRLLQHTSGELPRNMVRAYEPNFMSRLEHRPIHPRSNDSPDPRRRELPRRPRHALT